MHAHYDTTETAIAHAVVEELRRSREAQGPARPPSDIDEALANHAADPHDLGVSELVRLCHQLGETASDVLVRVLDQTSCDTASTGRSDTRTGTWVTLRDSAS
jgi:hypothetical protein